ncbi:hypothetical protein BU17DRAFT_68585 [Hysterangium stoloniferum]|nr:hypothetical protein BU17DRAFT_68585 [Hysterangium stoloniferum]
MSDNTPPPPNPPPPIKLELITNSLRNTTISDSTDNIYHEVRTESWIPLHTKVKRLDPEALDHLVDNPDANKVMEWRHKLQRAFLNKTTPKAEEMPEYDQLFTIIENHEVTIEQLAFSKLGKLMRHISRLDQTRYPIANEEQYNIRGRADALLEKWQKMIELSGANGGSVNGSKAEKAEKSTTKTVEFKESEAKPSTNGNTSVDKPDNDAPETDVTVAPTADEEFPKDIADD